MVNQISSLFFGVLALLSIVCFSSVHVGAKPFQPITTDFCRPGKLGGVSSKCNTIALNIRKNFCESSCAASSVVNSVSSDSLSAVINKKTCVKNCVTGAPTATKSKKASTKKTVVAKKKKKAIRKSTVNQQQDVNASAAQSLSESSGPILDLLKKWFKKQDKNKKKQDEEKKEPVKPKEETPPEKKQEIRTVTEEKIWEFFEKLYMSAHTGACDALTCSLMLPEAIDMSNKNKKQFDYDYFLNTVASKVGQEETFAESYRKFLFGLNVPLNLTLGGDVFANHELVLPIRQQISVIEELIAQEEDKCSDRYESVGRMFPGDYESFKNQMCLSLNKHTVNKYALQGKLQSVRSQLYNGWEIAVEAQKQYNAVNSSKRTTWIKHVSLEDVVRGAQNGDESTMSMHFSASGINGVQNKVHSKSGESIYPDIIRPGPEVKGPELDFNAANQNVSDAQFQVRFGAQYLRRVMVEPNNSWFSRSAISAYRARDDYKPNSNLSQDYFFNSEHGSLVKYPESVYIMIQPFVKITVSKLTEKYVRQLRKVSVFNVVFNIDSGDQITSQPCPLPSDDCVLMTFATSSENFTPLLFSVKNKNE